MADWKTVRTQILSLDAGLRECVWAAAVPHWFDAAILGAMCPMDGAAAARLYIDLQALPFVDAHPAGGHTISPSIREPLLNELWAERRETYVAWSTRLAEHFRAILTRPAQGAGWWARIRVHPLIRLPLTWLRRSRRTGYVVSTSSHVPLRIEQLYHAIVAGPQRARDLIGSQGLGWFGEREPDLTAVTALVNAIDEQARAGRANGKLKDWSRFFKAEVAHQRHDFDRARRLLIPVVARAQDDWLRASAAFALGMLYRETWAPKKARPCARLALSYHESWNNRLGQSNCHWLLSYLDLRDHRLDEAKREALRAMSLLHRPSLEANALANCYWTLGEIEAEREAGEAARAYYERARSLYEQVGSRLGVGNCLASLGQLELRHGRLRNALHYFNECLTLAEGAGLKLSIANVFDDLGRVHRLRHEYDQAAARLALAAELHQAIRNPVSEANARVELGLVERARRRPAEAAAEIERGLEILRAYGQRASLGFSLAQAALLPLQREDFASAVQMLREGARVAAAAGDVVLEANIQRRLARLHSERSEFDLAAEALRAADACLLHKVAEYPLTRAVNLACAADLALAQGELARAGEHVSAAALLFARIDAGDVEVWKALRLGELAVLAGDLSAGREHLETADRLAAETEKQSTRLACLESLALWHALDSDPTKALTILDAAIGSEAYPPAYLLLARAHQHGRVGHLSAMARDLAEAGTAGAPASALAYGRARLALASNDPETALRDLRTVLAVWPKSPLVHIALGLAHLAAGQADQAFECVREGLQIEPCCPTLSACVDLHLDVRELEAITGPQASTAHALARLIADRIPRPSSGA